MVRRELYYVVIIGTCRIDYRGRPDEHGDDDEDAEDSELCAARRTL